MKREKVTYTRLEHLALAIVKKGLPETDFECNSRGVRRTQERSEQVAIQREAYALLLAAVRELEELRAAVITGPNVYVRME